MATEVNQALADHAQALLDQAGGRGQRAIDQVQADLDQFARLLVHQVRLRKALADPGLPPEPKRALLADLGRPRGVEVVAVPLHAEAGQVVSSTRVRGELAGGDVAAAAASLGRPYAVEGEVVEGDRRGRPLLGVPTANLAAPAGIAIPGDGVYAGHLTDGADGEARPAAISVGTNPQFGTERRVEAHVLDFDGDLYGHRVSVDFHHHLRGQATFPGVDELVAQIRADIDQTRRLLGAG